jgi:hypothetical protein
MDYSKTVDYSNTYWSRKGKYPEQNAALEKLIPDSGAVPNPRKNKALERFRVASNCYYDLYNNGLCNRAASFAKTFGFSGRALMAGRIKTGGLSLTQTLIDQTETWMDEIVLAAYQEQSCTEIVSHDGTQWGHWTGRKFKPCNKMHPGQPVQECACRILNGRES